MKLYKDGTIEGTPQEIAEYNKLMIPCNIKPTWPDTSKSSTPYPNPLMPTITSGTISTKDITKIQDGSRPYTATL